MPRGCRRGAASPRATRGERRADERDDPLPPCGGGRPAGWPPSNRPCPSRREEALIDPKRLLADLQRLTGRLVADFRARADADAATERHLREEYARARAAGRTGMAYEAWREDPLTQAAVAWVLSTVFVRFLEDNGFLDARGGVPHRYLWGTTPSLRALAQGHYEEHLRRNPAHAEREYLLSVFEEVGRLPGARHLFDRRHNPALTLSPTADGAAGLLKFWKELAPGSDATVHDFEDPSAGTRFLGDLYQDLSEEARSKYALLQTPGFVEEFLLDRTLTPAIEELGYEEVSLIDPACGSGHFLLGAFERLASLWQRNQPGLPGPAVAQKALAAVHGVDLNPFAAAIARFRLLVAALGVAGVKRLADAPDLTVNVAVGDSLLHGPRPGVTSEGRATEDRQLALVGEDRFAHLYETEDAEELRRILFRRYSVVVANPPYITVKDAGLNGLYRERFGTCHRQYSLVCPFLERLVDLCERPGAGGRGTAGWLGAIVSNAFMKREFGSKLVEDFLPRHDLTHVLDTSGAYIPGHGTPTVILLMRGRPPVGGTVRAVMGIRGEPTPPDDPAKGLVWTEIVGLVDRPGERGAFVSVSDVERERFAKHPWSLGGGGAAELKSLIDSRSAGSLGALCADIGRTTVVGEDDVWIMSRRDLDRIAEPTLARPLVIGDSVRDWRIEDAPQVIYPYVSLGGPPVESLQGALLRHLWCFRTLLAGRTVFGKSLAVQGRPWWEHLEHYKDKLRTPLSIAFAFVATHNHFVLDRGGKVFKQSAPVIKLPPTATEDDHLGLLGLLNSSTACFWMKQVCHNKGATSDTGILQADPEKFRFEFDGTKLSQFPLTVLTERQRGCVTTLAMELQACGDALGGPWVAEAVERSLNASKPLKDELDAVVARRDAIRSRMVRLQEELDWLCYELYGLLDRGDPAGSLAWTHPIESMPPLAADARPYRRRGMEADESWAAIDRLRWSVLQADHQIGLIERPEYKRRWFRSAGAYDDRNLSDQMLIERALRSWLLDRLEEPRCWPADASGAPSLQSATQLCDRVRHDEGLRRVAELYAGRPDVDLERLVADLALEEAVPYLAAFRYTDDGLRKRLLWERTWDLQRAEDRGEEVGEIPVPPKYAREDFRKGSYWSLRGKLDVPKERFVHYPEAERAVDPAPVLGWAGWDPLQRARALAAYYEKVKAGEAWPKERLVP
ncbi:BREX-2 system adenine-specific DNA-methyltransferase PglX, partial [Acidobacteria bacterium ACD]|nr:BREX-2 system adenine-specific DNA-methyltransferase PglX [Acidobacteria bacterium ACD]